MNPILAITRLPELIIVDQPVKLMKIPQESLGSRTKTSIAAAITPSHRYIGKTLSKSKYAYGMKDTQNKPEVKRELTTERVIYHNNTV
uniref:Uncharacterized protein n=1 Tax=Glossina morsitans morsitans TaxID=37546 RepID=A0A1B0FAC7_GLOMM